jgi:hypothetical protein
LVLTPCPSLTPPDKTCSTLLFKKPVLNLYFKQTF